VLQHIKENICKGGLQGRLRKLRIEDFYNSYFIKYYSVDQIKIDEMKMICSLQGIDEDECYSQILKPSDRLKDQVVDGRMLLNLRIDKTSLEISKTG
jgi:hypothetical protein